MTAIFRILLHEALMGAWRCIHRLATTLRRAEIFQRSGAFQAAHRSEYPSGGFCRRRRSLAIWLPIIVLLGANIAAAQQVTLRSGAHPGFTRLVLDVPEALTWSGRATQQGTAYRVEFGRPGYAINLDDAFNRIDRSRVSGVEALPDGGGIVLSLSCDCKVEASRFLERMIVLDISPRDDLHAAAAGDHEDPGNAADSGALAQTTGSQPALNFDPLGGRMRDPRQRALLPRFNPAPIDPSQGEASRTEMAQALGIADEFGQTLVEQLARGATEGVLLPEGSIPGPEVSTVQPNLTAPGSASAPVADSEVSAELLTGSPSQGFGASAVVRIGGQSTCTGDRELDLSTWFGDGGEAGALARMGRLRSQLMGEFDRIDRQVQTDLARLYISLGFGTEARALLQLDDRLPDPVLMTLASLSEGGSDPAGVFAGQSECAGRAALWALLGARALPKTAEVSEGAILKAFEELPLGLRQTLGPKLAERFAEEGYTDSAGNVLSRLGRALGRSTDAMRLAAARVARLSDETEQAEDLLARLLDAPGELGVAAAVERIDLATEEGGAVDAELVDLTAAYSTERRGTEQQGEVWLAHVRAAWANGEFDRAFDEIAAAADLHPELRHRARDETLRALAEHAGEGTFLRRALDPENLALAQAYPKTAAQMAERLLALGLPGAAGHWLSGPAPPGMKHSWRRLAAMKSLAEQEPEAAEIALVGLQGDDILRLRAKAREMMGDYEFARDAYRKLGDAQDAARLAWLAGDFEATAQSENPILAAVARLSDAAPTGAIASEGTGPSLAQGQALVESGDATAEAIRDLLAQTELPGL